ncbi:MAG: NIPSNAP family protein [Acidobacteria bacterium]|nr:NIPSNAP family protein [Acidobacteriota bacterium]
MRTLRLVFLTLGMVTLMNADVFELRTYYAMPGKLQALHSRFRNHTLKLFEKHGMNNVGYWAPTDQAKKPGMPDKGNTLIYVLRHKSREAATASWKAFREDPEWIKARDASEKDGKLVDHVDAVFMEAVDYSPMK